MQSDAGNMTSESPDDVLVQLLRAKSPAEKIEMVSAAHRTARMLAAAGIRYQHPNWDETQVAAEVLRRLTGGAS